MQKLQRTTSCAIIISLALISMFSSCTKSHTPKFPTEKVFRFNTEGKIATLDPHKITDVYSNQAASLFYEPLFEYHYLKRPYTIIPLLAESLPVYSKDKKTFTLKLKKGIRFHDDPCFEATQGKGRELLADDVSYMIHRISAPRASFPSYSYFEHKIQGIDAYRSGHAPFISGIKIIDPYTLEIKLTAVLPRFIYALTDVSTSIVPKECVLKYKDDFNSHPVGTGPFVAKLIDRNFKVVGEKNPNYKHSKYPSDGATDGRLLQDAGRDLPLTNKVVLEVITERQPAWLKFLSGELDINFIPKDSVSSTIKDGKLIPEHLKKGLRLYSNTRADVCVSLFNFENPVWGKNKLLRQAFALSLDIPKIIAIQYSGQAVQAHSIIDPSQYGYDSNFRSKWAKRDIKKAKELLAQAGYIDGKGLPPIIMPTTNDTASRHLDELMTKQLAESGIVLRSMPMTWPELDKVIHEKKTFTMVGIGYSSGIPDAEDALILIHSKNKSPGPNNSNYANPEVDHLIDEIEKMDNGPDRFAKIRKIVEIIDEELPMHPTVHRVGNQVVQPWVKNHIFTDFMFLGRWVKYHDIEVAGENK